LYHLKEFERDSEGSSKYFEKYLMTMSWKAILKWWEAKGKLAFYAFKSLRKMIKTKWRKQKQDIWELDKAYSDEDHEQFFKS